MVVDKKYVPFNKIDNCLMIRFCDVTEKKQLMDEARQHKFLHTLLSKVSKNMIDPLSDIIKNVTSLVNFELEESGFMFSRRRSYLERTLSTA